jgi:hypothetical protein
MHKMSEDNVRNLRHKITQSFITTITYNVYNNITNNLFNSSHKKNLILKYGSENNIYNILWPAPVCISMGDVF